jgi:hypothetical protein
MRGTTLRITPDVNDECRNGGGTFRSAEAFPLTMKPLFLTLALALAAASGTAHANSQCSSEVLKVRDVPVTVQYCIAGAETTNGPEIRVPVEGNYSSPTGTFARTSVMRFVAGEGPARVLENVDLSKLGLGGTLHLTLAYSGGLVRVENAMLTPGAITVK